MYLCRGRWRLGMAGKRSTMNAASRLCARRHLSFGAKSFVIGAEYVVNVMDDRVE